MRWLMLMLLLFCCGCGQTYPELYYGESVYITEGFYKGQTGSMIGGGSGMRCIVKLKDGREIYMRREYIQRIENEIW